MIRFVSINNVIGGLEVGLVRRGMNQRLISEIQGEDRKVPKPGGCREEGWIRERETELLVMMTRGRRWLSDLAAWL